MKTLLIALVVTLLPATVLADTVKGQVDNIDYKKRTIIIGDRFFQLAGELQILDVDGNNASLFTVKKGSYISGEFDRKLPGQKKITSLKILLTMPAEDGDDSVQDD